jgi:hypothetical protein
MSDIHQLEAFLIDQLAVIFHNAMRFCSTPEGLISLANKGTLLGFLLGGRDYGFRLQLTLFQLQGIANESLARRVPRLLVNF